MIVRVLNTKQDTDRFYDCRNSGIRKSNRERKEDGEEFLMDFEFEDRASLTVVLVAGDAIYYMNDTGATVHADRRMCK